MLFRGLEFLGFSNIHPGVYRLLGRENASEEDLRVIAEFEGAATLHDPVGIPREDLSEFLLVRYNLRQLRNRFGDPSFLVQHHSSGRDAEQVSFEQALHGSLANQPHAPLRTTFGFDSFGEFDRREGRRVEMVLPNFEAADDLIIAMLSPRFRFFPVPMFPKEPIEVMRVSALLDGASELDEFRKNLFGAFSVVMMFNKEGLFSLLTTDAHLVRDSGLSVEDSDASTAARAGSTQ